MIAPTLLVGLGGTGSKIVCRVSKMVTKEQRRHIGFAVFDTDINELREIREENPYIKIFPEAFIHNDPLIFIVRNGAVRSSRPIFRFST